MTGDRSFRGDESVEIQPFGVVRNMESSIMYSLDCFCGTLSKLRHKLRSSRERSCFVHAERQERVESVYSHKAAEAPQESTVFLYGLLDTEDNLTIMIAITKEQLAQAVYEAIPRIACVLPHDVRKALESARAAESNARGAVVLDQLLENADIAERDHVPICQDTGTVWVCLEIGPDVSVAGDVFAQVNDAVARAYTEAHLRKSVVRDALLDRSNTGDNTPAFTDIHCVDTPGARVHVLLKGGGSDNASRVTMLTPGAGREGIISELLDCVRHKAANACPPLVIGVGIGGTFDKVAGMAKSALLRKIGTPASDARVAKFEQELLETVNATGMGPGALGGKTLALAVHVNTAPCHIAALPLAINMGCSAMRRTTVELVDSSCEVLDAASASEGVCSGALNLRRGE